MWEEGRSLKVIQQTIVMHGASRRVGVVVDRFVDVVAVVVVVVAAAVAVYVAVAVAAVASSIGLLQ